MECGAVCGDYKLYNTILQQFAVKQFLRPFKVVFPILVYGESGLSLSGNHVEYVTMPHLEGRKARRHKCFVE